MARARGGGRVFAGRGWLVAVLVYVLTTAVFVGPALIQNRTMGGTEILRQASPYREGFADERQASNPLQTDQMEQIALVAEFWKSLRDGRVQLWEPDVGTGVPLFTGVHNRVLAPFHVGFLFVPLHLGTTVSIALGLFVAQISTYGLARRLGATSMGAILAGVVYAFSGPVTALMLRIYEAMLLPALLLAVHGSMTERDGNKRIGWLCLSAVVSAGIWTSGFPAAGLFCFYFAAAFLMYLGVRWYVEGPHEDALRGVRRVLPRVSVAAVPIGVGTALAAPQLLPTYQFLARSGAIDRTYGIDHRAGIAQLSSAVSGRFFGAYQDHDWWWPDPGYSNPVEASMTVGLVALGLIVLVVIGMRGRASDEFQDHLRRFFVPAGLVVLIAVYLGGLALRLVHFLPYMQQNSFGRARFIAALVIALVAAFAIDHLRGHIGGRAPARGSLRVQLGILIGLIAVGTYEGLDTAADLDALGEVWRDLLVPLAATVAALLVVRQLRARRRGPSTRIAGCLAIALLAAMELQWGAWGFIATSPRPLFYPQEEAFEAITPETAPGGQFRFSGLDLSVVPPNSAALLDLNDLRVSFPAWGLYRELIQAADPGVFDHRRLRTVFTDQLDPESSILDRMSLRFWTLPIKAPILGLGEPRSVVHPLPGSLPFAVEADPGAQELRAVRVWLEPADPSCREGWIEVEVGSVVSRRLLRETGGEAVFALPDISVPSTTRVELTSTHCPVRVTNDQVDLIPPSSDSELRVVSVDGWVVYGRPDARPRVELAKHVVRIDEESSRLRFLQEHSSESVVVSGSSQAADYSGGTAEFTVDAADEVEVRVRSDGPGLLVLRDVLAPGWTAKLDGRSVPIVTVDHAFRGVEVPSGRSTVKFTYRPRLLDRGLLVAAGGLLTLLAISAVVRRDSEDLPIEP